MDQKQAGEDSEAEDKPAEEYQPSSDPAPETSVPKLAHHQSRQVHTPPQEVAGPAEADIPAPTPDNSEPAATAKATEAADQPVAQPIAQPAALTQHDEPEDTIEIDQEGNLILRDDDKDISAK